MQEIPFETPEGNQYVLSFEILNAEHLAITKPIIDISLTLIEYKSQNSSIKIFNYLISESIKYIKDRNVILYYYCDTSEISYRKNRKVHSPQEYRNELFFKLFVKANSDDLHLKNIVVKDNSSGDHYIALIYKSDSTEDIEIISKELKNYEK